jgi:DNA polymerase-3 subunit epsilon
VYAVIDLETTGRRTSWHDRIAEIAVVQLDGSGRVEREWCSLVNPGRDLGPQHIHGITAAEARRAPTFDQLAGQVAALLRGRVCVAHNFAFDAAFLGAEFARLGVDIPLHRETALCTMRLAGQFLPTSGRGLADCCRVAGITLDRAHSALHDARAAAALLAHYLAIAGTPPPWTPLLAQSASRPWPPLDVSDVAPVARLRNGERLDHFLSRLVDQMPRLHRPLADEYLDVLDRALLDRHISATEADALVAVADSLDLGRAEVVTLHEDYLQALAAIALADGTLTTDERQDLDHVAVLLGLSPDTSSMSCGLRTTPLPPAPRRRPCRAGSPSAAATLSCSPARWTSRRRSGKPARWRRAWRSANGSPKAPGCWLPPTPTACPARRGKPTRTASRSCIPSRSCA